MNRNNTLNQQLFFGMLLISLFLQSCSTSINLPNQGERLEDEQIEEKIEIVSMEAEEATELGNFEMLPLELVQDILTYLNADQIKEVRGVNHAFYKLTTGYGEPGLVGVENRPNPIVNIACWVINKEIDFRKDKLNKLTPETIPSVAFYQLMGQIKNLPKEFWAYLQGTHVHTLNLARNQIDDAGASQLAQQLQGSRVDTLHLGGNQIGDAGASQLVQYLQESSVHTLNLARNQIGDAGASQLAQHLQESRVHTLDLSSNQIGAAGATQLAKHLQGSRVHTLNLGSNEIGDAGATQLAQHLQGSRVHTLDLSYNQIGAAGASELAQHLQGTNVHTLYLSENQIGETTQQLLKEDRKSVV